MATAHHRISFDGHVDISRYPEVRAAFAGAPPDLPVLIDLRDVSGVDSTFLAEMLLLRRRHPAPLAVLIAPGSAVEKVFTIAGFGQKMNVHTDPDAAVAALAHPPERTS